jgi:hypothetical protein
MDSFHHLFDGRWVRRARRRQEGQGEEGEVCWRECGRGEEQDGQREGVRQFVVIGWRQVQTRQSWGVGEGGRAVLGVEGGRHVQYWLAWTYARWV